MVNNAALAESAASSPSTGPEHDAARVSAKGITGKLTFVECL